MILVNQLLQITDAHRRSSEIIDLRSILFGLLLLRFQSLLIGHKFLLHQQIVLDALQLQEPELALGERSDSRKPSRRLGAFLLPLFASDAGRWRRRLELLLLLVIVFPIPGKLPVQTSGCSLTHDSSSTEVRKDLAVFRDEIPREIGDGELNPSGADGHQEVVVNEVVTAEGDEEERLVHKHRRRHASDQTADSLLIRDVVAVGEAAGGAVSGIVDAVRRRVSPGGGEQVVVVAVVNQRVPEHEERTCRRRPIPERGSHHNRH
nr:hypothetical protein CR513_38834 [Ipomoea batatas]GMD15567.1 hypothetical protein CR513_38834 [Ipomoea batatas]